MIRVCKSRLLSLAWMFKLLQISSNLITSYSLDIFLLSKARMAAFIVSIASSKSPAAYWAWPRAKSDLASGVACRISTLWRISPWLPDRSLIVSTATTNGLASLSCSLNSSLLTFCFFPGKLRHPPSEKSQMDSALQRKRTKPYTTQINQHGTLPFLKGVHTIALRLSFFFLFSRRRFIFSAILPCERG